MEADDGKPPTGSQDFQNCREGASEFLEFLVDVNPYSLKAACGRMLAFLASADGAGDELGEFERGAQRPGFAASNNRLCNLESKPFFAIICYDLLDLFKTGMFQPFGSGGPAAGIHTHIERAFSHEREAARCIIDLWRRHSQVQQDAVNLLYAQRLKMVRHVADTAMYDLYSGVFFGQGLCGLDGLRVRVEHDASRAGRQALQKAAAVPAPDKCAVYIYAVKRGCTYRGGAASATLTERGVQQGVDCGLQQHGTVHEFHRPLRKKSYRECPSCPWPDPRLRGVAA